MGELKFQKLTPTQDVDLSGYEEAFHYIFAEDDITIFVIRDLLTVCRDYCFGRCNISRYR